ncbi:MAG: hypothetical protein ACREX4_23910 [Gammaproteobacteria bacterium]
MDERLAVSQRQLVIGCASLVPDRRRDFLAQKEQGEFLPDNGLREIILIYAAAGFLGQEGCSIFGEQFFGY